MWRIIFNKDMHGFGGSRIELRADVLQLVVWSVFPSLQVWTLHLQQRSS